MADLSVEFAGVTFKNPILIASSSLTNHMEKLKRLEEAGAGGLITKAISNAPTVSGHTAPLRSYIFQDDWTIVGDMRVQMEEGTALIEAAKKQIDIPIIANFISFGEDEANWVELALALQKSGADMIEIDLNWPVPNPFDDPLREFDTSNLGMFPEKTGTVVKALKQVVDIPIIAKISPKFDLIGVAKACTENGIDGITVGNVFLGIPGVDIKNGGKPVYPFVEKGGLSPYMGAYLNPISNLRTAIIAKAFDTPLSSGGGLMSWENIIERIMLGAGTTQICSAVYLYGPGVIKEYLRKMEAYLGEYGYKNISEIEGMALPYISNFGGTVINPCLARIIETKVCLHCDDPCLNKVTGECLAMTPDEKGLPYINEETCNGCALCYWKCSYKNVSLVPK